MTMRSVWVVTGKSESGDDYGPWVFKTKPSQKRLKKLLREEAPGEWEEDGPGDFGSYVHLSTPAKVLVREDE